MAGRNQQPSSGGDVTEYTPVDETASDYGDYSLRVDTAAFHDSSDAELVFVNGMDNSPANHRRAARQLATITGQTVVGIYNQTGLNGNENIPNRIMDFIQCVHDLSLPVGRSAPLLLGMQALSNPSAVLAMLLARRSAGRITPIRQAERLAGEAVLSLNRASLALFGRLYDNAEKGKRTVIVCHSQGNLISANAVWVTKRTRHWATSPVGQVSLFGLASPTASWPPNNEDGFQFSLYRDDRDPVTLISVPGVGQRPTTQRGPGLHFSTHAIGNYFAFRRVQEDLARSLRNA